MIFEFRLPSINPHATEALIEILYPAPGSSLKTGDKLLDLSIDLSASFAQDCPPLSFFRIVMREHIVLREFCIERGQSCKVGDVLAVFSNAVDEPLDQAAKRGIRFATAGIIHHGGMWTGSGT
jgi:hypothetical protein